jgi:AraC-like DNA-binding protein
VRRLLALSLRGIAFSGKARVQAATWIKRLPEETGFRRVLCLLHALETLSHAANPQSLASPRYASVPQEAAGERLKRVYAFIGQRYREPFSLAEIAAHAHMTPSAFSRFFRRAAGTTLTEYLNELRVGYACARLCGSDDTIASVAYASGFESLPYFNRRFRALKGMSPGVFRRQFQR